MDLIKNKITHQTMFSVLQFLWSFENCLVFGFMVLYLADFGFTNYQSGALIALIAGVGILIQPFLGFVCDTKYSPKKIILISCIGIIITSGFLTTSKNSVLMLSINILILSLFCYSQGSIIDCWIVSASNQIKGIQYNSSRSFGSAGYSIAAVLIGKILSSFGYEVVYGLHYLVVILIILTVFLCPTANMKVENHAILKKGFYVTIKDLLCNKLFLLFCISVCFFQIALRTTGTYMAVFIKHMGGNETELGVAIFLSAICEIPALLFCSSFRGSKVKLLTIYAWATFILFVRLIQLIVFPWTFITIIMQIPQAIATGLYIGTFVEYLNIVLEHSQVKTGITLAYTITSGLGGCVGIYIGGWVIENAGIMNYVFFSEMMLLISIISIYILVRICKRVQTKEFKLN